MKMTFSWALVPRVITIDVLLGNHKPKFVQRFAPAPRSEKKFLPTDKLRALWTPILREAGEETASISGGLKRKYQHQDNSNASLGR
jgi:hypothetical protein